jgi:hypothetical protein
MQLVGAFALIAVGGLISTSHIEKHSTFQRHRHHRDRTGLCNLLPQSRPTTALGVAMELA